jgi:hypothetical protein
MYEKRVFRRICGLRLKEDGEDCKMGRFIICTLRQILRWWNCGK